MEAWDGNELDCAFNQLLQTKDLVNGCRLGEE